MSLFDVIKYPISDPPLMEELSALPDKIKNKIYLLVIPHPKNKKIPDYKHEVIYYAARRQPYPAITASGIKKLLEEM